MKILLVEDDNDSRKSMADFLDQLGHRVFDFSDGLKAFEFLKKETIHIVLSDIQMPGVTGLELLKKIKNAPKLKETVVVLFTGFRKVDTAIEALRNGAYDYLLKPVKPEELAALVDRVNEYLELKHENVELTEKFDEKLDDATKDIKKELDDIRKAYAQVVVSPEIGVFSDKMKSIFTLAEKLHSNPDIPVIIEGETGTGKEIIVRYIHYGSGNVTTPFIGLNCAAISPNLFESELFGYEPGAFTGGNPKGQKGKLELAAGGTIFLDEITELPNEYQAKLLRLLQEREYYRVGGLKKYKTDARFICATNQDIQENISEGKFREDLYYRLNVGRIKIPPIRERKEEILPLIKMFLNQLKEQKGARFNSISSEAASILEEHKWPGNVRELKNSAERIAFLWDEEEVKPRHLEFLSTESRKDLPQKEIFDESDILDTIIHVNNFDLKKWNLKLVDKALSKYQWNKAKTARFLNISRDELYTYLKRFDNNNN